MEWCIFLHKNILLFLSSATYILSFVNKLFSFSFSIFSFCTEKGILVMKYWNIYTVILGYVFNFIFTYCPHPRHTHTDIRHAKKATLSIYKPFVKFLYFLWIIIVKTYLTARSCYITAIIGQYSGTLIFWTSVLYNTILI